MMNKRELIYSIAEQTGYTQTEVRNILNTFINYCCPMKLFKLK